MFPAAFVSMTMLIGIPTKNKYRITMSQQEFKFKKKLVCTNSQEHFESTMQKRERFAMQGTNAWCFKVTGAYFCLVRQTTFFVMFFFSVFILLVLKRQTLKLSLKFRVHKKTANSAVYIKSKWYKLINCLIVYDSLRI